MLNTGGPCIKYNNIHVLRTKINTYISLYFLKSFCIFKKTRPSLVFSILGADVLVGRMDEVRGERAEVGRARVPRELNIAESRVAEARGPLDGRAVAACHVGVQLEPTAGVVAK